MSRSKWRRIEKNGQDIAVCCNGCPRDTDHGCRSNVCLWAKGDITGEYVDELEIVVANSADILMKE